MKTILLLGGYGFIGTNILDYIDKCCLEQYQVVVFDRFPKHLKGFKFQCVIKSYAGDFLDKEVFESIFDENNIDIIIHSLSSTIPLGTNNPQFDIESNLVPTLTILDLMVKHHVNDIVFISSGGAIYGTSNTPHVESEDAFPISSYGVVKLTIEKYLFQYASIYDIKPLVVRLSNPYGEFHYSAKQGICNVAIMSAVNNKELVVYGDGNSTKDYIYIKDFVDILFRLLAKGICCDVINIGSGNQISINEILHNVKLFFPSFSWHYESAIPYDVTRFALNTSKLLKYIGDYPFTDFLEGLEKTICWEKTNR